MGTRPPKDIESPPASTLFPPRLEHSRRGSIASLSSINQIDKETLSQALDHIHSTASQTDTLTTFNEFTSPPSSSSALDSKGIASDLQGGISGLYNRFRASVGNAKDALSAGTEDDTADSLSVRSLTKSSPSPSTKAAAAPTRAVKQGLAPGPKEARVEKAWQAPDSIPVIDNVIDQLAAEDRQATSNANHKSDLTSGPDHSDILLATRVEDNNSIAARGKSIDVPTNRGITPNGILATIELTKPVVLSAKEEAPFSRVPLTERPGIVGRNGSSLSGPLLGHRSSQNEKPAQNLANSDGLPEGIGKTEYSSDRTQPPSPTAQMSSPPAYGKPFPEGMKQTEGLKGQPPFAVDERPDARLPGSAIGPDQVDNKQALSDQTSRDVAGDRRGRPQHLDLTSRKSMAPPLISHTSSPKRRPSRASSTDTNTDSLNSAAQQTPVRQGHESTKALSRALPIAQTALRRDPRMINSFSQSRNKVLNKEYWMKDENARDCFNCGEAFSTFRRKHHCRKAYILRYVPSTLLTVH